jgi:hypothetical protein
MSRVGQRTVGIVHLVGTRHQALSITLFRVAPEYGHTVILTNLIDRVCDYCRECNTLTVHVESHVAPQWVLRQMDGRGMRLVRCSPVCGQALLEFRVEPAGCQTASPVRGASTAASRTSADALLAM